MMEIRLLKERYKLNEALYESFLEDKIKNNDEYLTNEIITLDKVKLFPIYIAGGSDEEKTDRFIEAFETIEKYYIGLDRDITLSERFWHSLLCTEFRDYILDNYPKVKDSIENFRNVVLKGFDWENYIYKCFIGAQYISYNVKDELERRRYYRLIAENLDVFNYIIKYSIFRNDVFLIKILNIIDKHEGLSKILKAKINDENIKVKFRLGKDERYGRRVIYEFNKSYPVVMVPMLSEDELENKFFEFLSMYYDITNI